jgi:hypothetical protein
MPVVAETPDRSRGQGLAAASVLLLLLLLVAIGVPFAAAHATGVFSLSVFTTRFLVVRREPLGFYLQGHYRGNESPGRVVETWSRNAGPFLVRLETRYRTGP